MTDDSREEQLNDTFETLESRERRYTLEYLQEEGYARREDIASYLEEETDADSDSLETALHHNHLPRMDGLGWVDYDTHSGDVSDATVQVDAKDRMLLDYLEDASDWTDEYLDEVFGTLKDENARKTMYVLETEEGGRSTLNGLTGHMTDLLQKDTEGTKHILHHRTLPALDDAGWIDYNMDSEKVSMTIESDTLPFTYLEEQYGDNT